MKSYLLQSAKNVLENNLVLLQGTKIHHIQCIARKFFCQILLCSSIHNNFGCIEIQGDVMTDCLAQSDTNAFLRSSFLFWRCSAATCVPTSQMGWDDGFLII